MSKPFLAFYGHHKGCTVWCSKILIEVGQRLGLKGDYLHVPSQFNFDLQSYMERRSLDYVSYANADIQYMGGVNHRGMHVIRDPRDTVVSGYFSHKNSHPTIGWPELVPHRERLQQMSFESGMIEEIDFSARLPTNGRNLNSFEALASWNYRDPDILELKFEDLTTAPALHFERFFSFAGVLSEGAETGPGQIDRATLRAILEQLDFQKLSSGRKPGEENVSSHYRKGQAGDWKDHFTPKVKDAFKRKHGPLLVQLGYESDENW